MKPELLAGALAELEAAYLHYELERPGRGDRFLRRVDQALVLVERHPGLGRVWREGASREPLRRLAIKRFPFGLLYLERSLVVVAVAHDRRGPGYWIDRLHEG